jgi:hypothetical protein
LKYAILDSMSRKPSPDIHFLVPAIHPGKPGFHISILDNQTSRYPSWTIGLPDIHPGESDFQISILDNRTSRYPSWRIGLPDIHPEESDFQVSIQ